MPAVTAIEIRLGLADRHAGLQPAHQGQPVVVAVRPRVGMQRDVHVGLGKPVLLRHHPHHGVRTRVEHHRAADERRIGAELPAPQRMAQDHDARRIADAIFVGAERPPQRRPHAEHGEQRVAGGHAVELLGLAGARQRQIGLLVGREAGERMVPGGEVEEVRIGGREVSSLRRRFPHLHQPVGCRKGQRTDDDRIDDSEDRRRGTDREREREHRRRRESRSLA